MWVCVSVVVGGSGREDLPLLAEGTVVVARGCVGPRGVGRLWCPASSSPLLAEGATGVVDGEGGDVMVLQGTCVIPGVELNLPRKFDVKYANVLQFLKQRVVVPQGHN